MKIPESIEEAIRSGNESELQKICSDLHPADAAAAFTSLNEKQQIKFAQFLNNDALSLITSFLPAPESADLIASLEEKDRTVILESLPDDVVTDLIQETDEDQQKTYVGLLLSLIHI